MVNCKPSTPSTIPMGKLVHTCFSYVLIHGDCGLINSTSEVFIHYIESWKSLVQDRFKKNLWTTLCFSVVQNIWQERNAIMFQRKTYSHEELIERIKMNIGFWIKYYA